MSGTDKLTLAEVGVGCFLFGMIGLGPLVGYGWMRWFGRGEAADKLRGAGVDHGTELGKCYQRLIVYLFAECGVGLGLTFLKVKLKLQQPLLKAVGKAAGEPSAQQDAERGGAGTREEKVESHHGANKAGAKAAGQANCACEKEAA